jgi:DNA transformation protein
MASPVDAEFIADLFSAFGPVSVRRMFGGAGLFADGHCFGIAFDGVIYFKTDDTTQPLFESEGSAPFVYPLMKKPRPRRKPSSFWRLPDRLYDDPDELASWARTALAVARSKERKPARRAAAGTSRKKSAARHKSRRRRT